MKRPWVIAVNAISGGGKTSLVRELNQSLQSSKAFYFDEFDSTNVYPNDFYDWHQRGASFSEFDCPGMYDAVTQSIDDPNLKFIILDYPFGRDHHRFEDIIDLSIFIDTPLDVAMARRIARDYLEDRTSPAEDRLNRLEDDLSSYMNKARHVYLGANKHKTTSDIVLDGWQSLESLLDEILPIINTAHESDS